VENLEARRHGSRETDTEGSLPNITTVAGVRVEAQMYWDRMAHPCEAMRFPSFPRLLKFGCEPELTDSAVEIGIIRDQPGDGTDFPG